MGNSKLPLDVLLLEQVSCSASTWSRAWWLDEIRLGLRSDDFQFDTAVEPSECPEVRAERPRTDEVVDVLLVLVRISVRLDHDVGGSDDRARGRSA